LFPTYLPPAQIQSRLLKLTALFLFIYALALTLSPAGRERSWAVDYRWSHWTGVMLWALIYALAHRQFVARTPDANPYLLPATALLSGWGMLSIWRLAPEFGLRQAAWIVVGVGVLIVGLRARRTLDLLYRYKYIFLFSGLFLTALTLVLGSNPTGVGARLWLGCCGLYFQPSEPLKLLLIVYLAAYFADRLPIRTRLLPLIFPTLVLTGLALAILLIQRDLGTASIFIFIYATMLYFASGKKRLLLGTLALLAVAGLTGYFLVDIIHFRLQAWINPWSDPAGYGYQIVQSLMAVANGGTFGRGPGMGSPGLVPVAQSDFIFTTISEENGLLGTLALFAMVGLITTNGFLVALKASGDFRRLLAAGLTTYLGAQSVLIMGGNLRLLPLTGVTLPFVAYGGSSLLTSFIALLILLQISSETDHEPAPLRQPQPYLLMAGTIWVGLLACALLNGWWATIRSDDLLSRTDNARRSISDRYVKRGSLLDRNNAVINTSTGEPGLYTRIYEVPELASISGYTHPVYGQAGLEESLDPYLRGLQGNPALLIWWDHLLYGQPPPGLDVRTSLDLGIQAGADQLLGKHTGAVVLINAQNGEILAMASHPGYDPNQLDTTGEALAKDPAAPLLNRATLGQYPAQPAFNPFLMAHFADEGTISDEALSILFDKLGFYSVPAANIQAADAAAGGTVNGLRVSPLQMALAAATLTGAGARPSPRLALAVNIPVQGWLIFPAPEKPLAVLSAESAQRATSALAMDGQPFWEYTSQSNDLSISWYLAGTLPNWQGTPLAIVVALEENDPNQARIIGRGVLKKAIQP
jgi:cell division protein FtsW (lipid II flippase)